MKFDSLGSCEQPFSNCGYDKRTIKGNGNETHPRLHAKQLIDYRVFRFTPTGKAEIAQCWKDEIREPIPAKGNAADDGEKGVARNFPSIVPIICELE